MLNGKNIISKPNGFRISLLNFSTKSEPAQAIIIKTSLNVIPDSDSQSGVAQFHSGTTVYEYCRSSDFIFDPVRDNVHTPADTSNADTTGPEQDSYEEDSLHDKEESDN